MRNAISLNKKCLPRIDALPELKTDHFLFKEFHEKMLKKKREEKFNCKETNKLEKSREEKKREEKKREEKRRRNPFVAKIS